MMVIPYVEKHFGTWMVGSSGITDVLYIFTKRHDVEDLLPSYPNILDLLFLAPSTVSNTEFRKLASYKETLLKEPSASHEFPSRNHPDRTSLPPLLPLVPTEDRVTKLPQDQDPPNPD